jgi:hypothetical protein
MPPPSTKRSLSKKQLAVLRAWVRQGAKWERHWAFEKPTRPELPGVKRRGWPINEIDRFVLARLEREGIEPGTPATRRRLLRRVTLDLTGLPPTPEELAAFVANSSENAYETVVDRLLASKRYGERMAWDWLDAARYADTNGYQGDQTRTMWPYRDWVVDALNRNLPYDKFVVWQLAGDLLPEPTFEQKLATGFCRNHMINGEGGRIAEENRVEYIFDQIETVGTIWLGLTVTCARCHDHKFDPLTQRNYYELFAYFNQTPVTGAGGNPQTAPTLTVLSSKAKKKIAERQETLDVHEHQLGELARKLLSGEGKTAWETRALEDLGKDAWTPLRPVAARSAGGQSMTIGPDHAILVGGKNPANDVYTVELALPAGRHTGLRLEALRHKSMTAGGLARSNSGNFVLTEITVEVREPSSKPIRSKIASGEATFEQGGLKVRFAFDGKRQTGWAVYNGKPIRRDHAAAFRFASPITVRDDATLVVTLRHDSGNVSHNLGHFRIATTDVARPRLRDPNSALAKALRTSTDKRTAKNKKVVRDAFLRSDAGYQKLENQRDDSKSKLAAVRERSGRVKVMVMADRPQKRKTYILNRGGYREPRAEVKASIPSFIAVGSADVKRNRLELARWLVSPNHPLTARVTMNRHWQKFFGKGLVTTTEDFGAQGAKPSHPALLDWLATEFVRTKWDVKAMHRHIVTSATYRQTARSTPDKIARDPENRLLSRGPRHRVPSWMIRDLALAASGLLVDQRGGPPVKSYQPAGIWADATFGKQRYKPDTGDKLYRRSLYTFWRRIIGPPVFFDSAKRQTCSVGASRTNTPLHALTTLNGVTYVEAARAMAQRALQLSTKNTSDRVAWVFELATSRLPTEIEVDVLTRRLSSLKREYLADLAAARKLLAVGESRRDESLPVAKHAAWTGICSLILNLDEALNK